MFHSLVIYKYNNAILVFQIIQYCSISLKQCFNNLVKINTVIKFYMDLFALLFSRASAIEHCHKKPILKKTICTCDKKATNILSNVITKLDNAPFGFEL